MKFQRLIVGLSTALAVFADSTTEAKGKCAEIQSYLKEKKINYGKTIERCIVNSNNDIIELSISNSELSEDNVNKLLSYKTIEKLNYEIYFGESSYEEGPKFQDFPSNLKSLTNLKELYLSFDKREQISHTFISIDQKEMKENTLKDLKIKSLKLYGINLNSSTIKEISTLSNLESLSFTECMFNDGNLDDLKNNKKLTNLYIGYKDKTSYSGSYSPSKLNLSNVKSLKTLSIQEFVVGQNIMNELKNLTFLEELIMDNVYFKKTNIDNQLQAYFDKISNLSKLTINFAKDRDDYEDNEFKRLVDLKLPKNLKILTLKGFDITDSNIKVISSISSLKELSINFNDCTKLPDIQKLNDLKNLDSLKLYGYEQPTTTTTKNPSPTTTPNENRCGKDYGSCKSGYCCSKYGWCGKTTDHCAVSKGCQSEFGECKNDNVSGKCGKGIGQCPSGYCCSKYGWCGKTTDHCAVSKGCQSGYGECKSESVSVNGQCGKGKGICPSGYCCSRYGWCGKSKDYCGSGCQSEFGKCN